MTFSNSMQVFLKAKSANKVSVANGDFELDLWRSLYKDVESRSLDTASRLYLTKILGDAGIGSMSKLQNELIQTLFRLS